MSTKIEIPVGDLTLNYMDRFSCIGPDCEDHCCYAWRVDIDRKHRDMMDWATRGLKEDRKFFKRTVVKRKLKPREKGPRYTIDHIHSNGACPYLDERALCQIHKRWGPDMLSDVCAVFPRRFQKLDNYLELTGTLACPEVTRQLLLHADGADVVPLDRKSIYRMIVSDIRDLRNIRPYWRMQREVRHFMISLLRKTRYPLEQRLFFMAYFAHRTLDVLNQDVLDGDEDKVRKEMRLFEHPKFLAKVIDQLDKLKTPAALVLLLARSLVLVESKGHGRSTFHMIVQGILGSYTNLKMMVPEGQSSKIAEAADQAVTQQVYTEYRRRKGLILERAADRIDQYFTNFCIHYWMYRFHFESPDLLVHMQRMLAQLAVVKFLLFSNPFLQFALDPEGVHVQVEDTLEESAQAMAEQIGERFKSQGIPVNEITFENQLGDHLTQTNESLVALNVPDGQPPIPAEPPKVLEPNLDGSIRFTDEAAKLLELPPITRGMKIPDRGEDFLEVLDRAVVDTTYKIGRAIEHSTLIHQLEQVLEKRELRSLAGVVYLVRF